MKTTVRWSMDLSNETIDDLWAQLISALEQGAIEYWGVWGRRDGERKMIDGDAYPVSIFVRELDEDGATMLFTEHRLDLAGFGGQLARIIEEFGERNRSVVERILHCFVPSLDEASEVIDTEIADWIMQLILLGEIVYG